MKALFLNMPWSQNGRLGVRAGSRWPFTVASSRRDYIPYPFFLGYAAALAGSRGVDSTMIDAIARALDVPEFLDMVSGYGADVIVAETATPSFYNDIKILGQLAERGSKPVIILCGSHASVFCREILREYGFIDYVIIGEYEFSAAVLIERIRDSLPVKDLSALAYRYNGEVRVNDYASSIDDLDSLPWPQRDQTILNYKDGFCALPQPSLQILSSRGCPYRCDFCLFPQVIYRDNRCRLRSPGDVIAEMEAMVEKYGFRSVYFDDDTFNIDREHVLNICGRIRKSRLDLPWAVMARADRMDFDLLNNLSQAGLYAVKYGIESADPAILKNCGKDFDLGRTLTMIEYTRKLGIKVHLTFCVGLPGETRETVAATKNLIRQIRPDSWQVSCAVAFPGTRLYEKAVSGSGSRREDFTRFDGGRYCTVRDGNLSGEEIRSLIDGFGDIDEND